MHGISLCFWLFSHVGFFFCVFSLAGINLSLAYYSEMRNYGQSNENQPHQFAKQTRNNKQWDQNGHMERNRYPIKNQFINENFATNHHKQSGKVNHFDKSMVYPGNQQNNGPVNAPVKSMYSVEYMDADIPKHDVQPLLVHVEGSMLPIILHFRSVSSPIQLHQIHVPYKSGDLIQETKSEDEPQILKHTVTKPIIQEVREIITPFRRILQEIMPVNEVIRARFD